MKYIDELTRAMSYLAEKKDTIFLGQAVKFKGTGLFATVEQIPESKKIELPVQEDLQMGMSIGLSLEGMVPISIFPRMDFLILALNQLVNHLDKIEEMSDGQFKPKVIIRTAIGSVKPLYPGTQHCQDITEALNSMCKNINIVKLDGTRNIFKEYKKAYDSKKSTILTELPNLYSTDVSLID